jgi:hypothetical protein
MEPAAEGAPPLTPAANGKNLQSENFFLTPLGSRVNIPSNAHISTPFFQKTVFFSKIFFGKPPSKFLEVCLNSEYM